MGDVYWYADVYRATVVQHAVQASIYIRSGGLDAGQDGCVGGDVFDHLMVHAGLCQYGADPLATATDGLKFAGTQGVMHQCTVLHGDDTFWGQPTALRPLELLSPG